MRKPRIKKLLIDLIISAILAAAVVLFATHGTREKRRLAEAGDAEAQYRLGLDYYDREDYAEAARWWRLAAENYSSASSYTEEAAYRLGDLYYRGWGVPEDNAEAEKWLRRGAEHGSSQNQFDLGKRYYHGWGVKEDKSEAVKWWRLAVGGRHEPGTPGTIGAAWYLGEFYQGGGDPAEAAEWFRRAAEQRYVNEEGKYLVCAANYRLGELHYEGRGVPQDHAEAAKRYRRAAEPECDNKDAQYRLGILYRQGLGVPKSAESAAKWWTMAVNGLFGNSEARYQLGELYYLGEGVPQDRAMAAKWLCEVRDDVEAAMEALVRWDLDCPK